MTGDVTLRTTTGVQIPAEELEFSAVRARGPGGQKVNKSSTAIQLRFDIGRSSAFTDAERERLLAVSDQRLTTDGVLVIRAEGTRHRERNRAEAIARLMEFLDAGLKIPKTRKPTRPGRRAVEKRLKAKSARSAVKATRKPPDI